MQLTIDGVTKSFGGLVAVNNASFTVTQNEILGLIGPNGAGKTTLFQIITGLERSTTGQIIFNDTRIDGLPPFRITRLGIARTFQIMRVFAQLTVLENVMVGRHLHTNATMLQVLLRTPGSQTEEDKIHARAHELLRFLNLEARASDRAGILTPGQQRLVEIARALATDPKLLLLDEPSAGLTPQESARLKQTIQLIRNDLGITVVIIEHDMHLLMNVSDRVIVLNYGRKIAEGTPGEVRSNPEVISAYLGKGFIHAAA